MFGEEKGNDGHPSTAPYTRNRTTETLQKPNSRNPKRTISEASWMCFARRRGMMTTPSQYHATKLMKHKLYYRIPTETKQHEAYINHTTETLHKPDYRNPTETIHQKP